MVKLDEFVLTCFVRPNRSAQKIGEGQFSRYIIYAHLHIPTTNGAFDNLLCGSVFIGKYFGDVVAVKKQTRHGKDLEKYLLRWVF